MHKILLATVVFLVSLTANSVFAELPSISSLGEPTVYQDSNGGTWELSEGDDLFSGTYQRKNKDGDVVSEGTWGTNRQGRVAFNGGEGYEKEDITWIPTRDGYSYQGFDSSGTYSKGTVK